MSDLTDENALQDIINRRGESFVLNRIKEQNKSKNILTVVSNGGLHPIPSEYIRGEIFFASEGNLDFSDIDSVNRELDVIVYKLKNKLFSQKWEKIYLLPFGHAVISMTIKMTVYRLLRIETIDIFYFGSGRYDFVDRDSRSSILGLK